MLTSTSETVICITYRYNQELHAILKRSTVATWQQEQKCFVIPEGGKHILALASELKGSGWLWLSQELQLKDVVLLRTLWEQTH